MPKYKIGVHGCDDSTYIYKELNQEELKLVKQIAEEITNASSSGCMPTMEVEELIITEDVLDNIRYANSCDRLKYRGLLYCTPNPINTDDYDLRRA